MLKLFNIEGLCWSQPCLQDNHHRLRLFHTVSFADQVRVDEIPGRDSLSRRQKRALWYPNPTKESMQMNIFQQLLCGHEHNGDADEIHTGYNDKSHYSFPVEAVLTEQENQRGRGRRVDPEEIAKVYQRCSSYSAIRAQMRAWEVEQDALEYLSKPARHGRAKITLREDARKVDQNFSGEKNAHLPFFLGTTTFHTVTNFHES
jgi:hypothetical protein